MDKSKPIDGFASLTVRNYWAPPEWALLERLLFRVLNEAAVEFVRRYTRSESDATLIWRESWPGMDGSDDPYEGFMNLPLLYSLGGSDDLLPMAHRVWDAITWQWTQYGQIHDEFDGYYDWMHHGEGYLYFYFFGLTSPSESRTVQRAVKFAGFYSGEHPEAANYDKRKKLMRSPITGSRGPRHIQTEEDWVTHREVLDNYLPPFEDIPGIDGNGSVCLWSDDRVYGEILKRINERQSKGDVPLNLLASSLLANAYMYTGDEQYRTWVLDYLEAWQERTKRNGGITPDNIGLSGEIGEYNDGKWWGGYYGWRWPHGSFSILEPLVVAGSNAVLLTGDRRALDLARSQLDMLWEKGKLDDGIRLVPNRHYDDGWRDFRIQHPMYPIYLWNISMAEEDAQRAERGWPEGWWEKVNSNYNDYDDGSNGVHMGFNANTAQWFRYIRGQSPDYPENLLSANLETIARQLEKLRSDEFDPRRWDPNKSSMDIHIWQELTPLIVEGLAQLTLGGPMHLYHGGLQHARVRYYDASKRRPGLPEDVAALVEHLTDDTVTLQLVNMSLFEEKELIVQAGTFGEHRFVQVEQYGQDGGLEQIVPADGKWFHIRLGSGAGAKLHMKMERYMQPPSYATPWSAAPGEGTLIRGRELD
ncbi:hypothetical protein [Paenibacillus sp. GCM10027626]|uniref:hypothetical protein n=1 Tax=Paenibacillus sp. GCM10027626 TaxID=3273411 RepID=UPI00362E83BF